jgi:hypothetical protein
LHSESIKTVKRLEVVQSDKSLDSKDLRSRSSRIFHCEGGLHLRTLRTAALAIDDIPVLPVDAGQQWKPIQCGNLGGRVTLAGSVHSYRPPCFHSRYIGMCISLDPYVC